jgi:plasmid stabilization system protein ParE
MKRFRLAPEAAHDIREIWAFIATDSIRSARKVRLQILDACQRLAENPGIGHTREDLTDKPLLFWTVGSYLIIYRADRKPVQIVAVTHGSMDIPAVLRRREVLRP